MDTTAPLKYDQSFRDKAEEFLQECISQNKQASIAEFAKRLGTTEETIWAWANKRKKDEQGNVTEELARPKFLASIQAIQNHKIQPKTKAVVEKKETIKDRKLNPKQELFCYLYATERDFFGNGVDSYVEAYDIDKSKPNWYHTAAQSASRLLSNVDILTRIDELLELGPLNDTVVDKQLAFIIQQSADLDTKLGGIKEYNKLRQRITDKIDHTTNGKDMPQPIYAGRSTDQ